MTIPGRLAVGSDGRLTGPASLQYNDPWPCANSGRGSGAMMGVVQHTMVGNLPGTIAEFNDPASQASAFFGVDQDGNIHQFLPVGQGCYSWAQEAGNLAWYSIEFADDGNPDNPMTPEQVTAGAQLVECLSSFAGFPLAEANSVTEKGFGVHYMGGAAWGGHTCPDVPPAHVRSSQRPAILALATEIRSGRAVKTWTEWTTGGDLSLVEFAKAGGFPASTFLRVQVEHYGAFNAELSAYIGAGDLNAKMPKGIQLWTLA